MSIDLIKTLECGVVVDEHGHVLSGTAQFLYMLHRPISGIQEREIKAGKAFAQKYLCA